MDQANSPLRLETSFYDQVVIEAVEGFQPESSLSLFGDIGLELQPGGASAETWAVVLTVAIRRPEDEPPPPYDVRLRAIGHFRWEGEGDDDATGEELERVVAVNGASVLFSGMRELVALVTGRGPWGQMLLPTLDFRSIPHETKHRDVVDHALGDVE